MRGTLIKNFTTEARRTQRIKELRARRPDNRKAGFLAIWLSGFLLCLVSCSQATKSPFDADQAFEYLQKQCDFGPRPSGSDAHKETKNYLISEVKKFSKEVIPQDFVYQSQNGPLELTNIIAIFRSDDSKSNKKVLLAAHWDTRPFADHDPDPKNRNTPIIGANDGASGVAILLELCRIFQSNPPGITVIVVLFDGEDYGVTTDEMFLGSRYFASNMDNRWEPDYGILIDMVGDKDLDIYIEPNSYMAAPDIVRKVWDAAERLKLKGIHNDLGRAVYDDHIPLIQSGIKCIDIIDFNYPYWHTLKDTPDKCSPKSLDTVGRLLLAVISNE